MIYGIYIHARICLFVQFSLCSMHIVWKHWLCVAIIMLFVTTYIDRVPQKINIQILVSQIVHLTGLSQHGWPCLIGKSPHRRFFIELSMRENPNNLPHSQRRLTVNWPWPNSIRNIIAVAYDDALKHAWISSSKCTIPSHVFAPGQLNICPWTGWFAQSHSNLW